MTIREQVISAGTQRYVRHIEDHGWTGTRPNPSDLAWEIVEGIRSFGPEVDSYCAGISDRSAEQLCNAIVNKGRESLRLSGLNHDVIVSRKLRPPW